MSKSFLTLLLIQIRGMSWATWVFFSVPLLMFALPLFFGMEQTNLDGAMVMMPCIYPILLANLLLLGGGGASGGPGLFGLFPNGEFLLSRPLTRRACYAAYMLIYFGLVVGPPLLNLGYSFRQSEIHLSFYQPDYISEDVVKRDRYAKILPGAYLEEGEKTRPDVVWPHGLVYLAWWQLSLVLVSAVVVQLVAFLRFSNIKAQLLTRLGIGFSFLALIFCALDKKSGAYLLYEGALTTFIIYLEPILVLLALGVIAAQIGAFRLAKRSEVEG